MQTILVKCLEKIVFPLHSKYTLHKRSAAQLPKILIRNLTKGGTYPQLTTNYQKQSYTVQTNTAVYMVTLSCLVTKNRNLS